MENKEKRSIVPILLASIIFLIIGCAGGYYYAKSLNTDKNSNNNSSNNKNTNSNEKVNLSSSEISDFTTLFNKKDYNAFLYINYSKPEEVLKSGNDLGLIWGLYVSDYSKEPTEASLKNAEAPLRKSSLSDIKKFLKDHTNIDFEDSKVKEFFAPYYKQDLNVYAFYSGGVVGGDITITSGYKQSDKYYLKTSNDINVTLQKVGNKYYFVSCDYLIVP